MENVQMIFGYIYFLVGVLQKGHAAGSTNN